MIWVTGQEKKNVLGKPKICPEFYKAGACYIRKELSSGELADDLRCYAHTGGEGGRMFEHK